MSSSPKKLYWDSSCFICFLNADEERRRIICQDILDHARNRGVELWTSTWTIAEVIRPRRHGAAPLPLWAIRAIATLKKEFPAIEEELPRLWNRYQSSDPMKKLTSEEISLINGMFRWPYVQKVNLDERIAGKAVELARDYGLKPSDSVHAASAMMARVSVLQRWDRDFDKVKHLVPVEEPQQISAQNSLFAPLLSPKPGDFVTAKQSSETDLTSTAEVSRSSIRLVKGEAATESVQDQAFKEKKG